ncbi:SDR family NAD(P)-dependent oxidoreductase [Nisaea acidiphila]|uniref:SDR family NAD(P)-dependent oxidoreductase n=1 Tax=Nisaea acidiphila TaxID=1862145 RepID=A0A9J7AVE8_9PROT|nr:SDR family NAD(P)-dependent oxidoreductase [Nisaea acidiphila]UUX49389.1 SDR family NAD(P)-dependent oxidoreductase [Nisaea acidiphila]
MRAPESILITGASSGIGAALAIAYAAPGITLHLGGRDEARLEETAAAAETKGAIVRRRRIDVTDRAAMDIWIAEADVEAPLDLVIANAGISLGTGDGGPEPAEQVRRLYAVNVDGVMNTALPALEHMRKRGNGQIAVMSSLAGFRGFPGAPAYCGSKAAVRVFGEGLRPMAAREGIAVNVICPGYVRSPMTAVNDFPMPFLMEVERAAELIRRGLARNKARIAFPWPVYATVLLLQMLPPSWIDGLMGRLPTKGGSGK